MTFDPTRAAELEVGYWIEHRRLIGNPDKESFIEAMTALHCHLFDLPPDAGARVGRMARQRQQHGRPDHRRLSTDPEADWARLEDELRQCYLSVSQDDARLRPCSKAPAELLDQLEAP